MPPGIREIYHEALPRLVAQEQLRQIQAASFPNMKKSARRSALKRLEREAKRREDVKVQRDVREATKELAQLGIPVQFVDSEGKPTESSAGEEAGVPSRA